MALGGSLHVDEPHGRKLNFSRRTAGDGTTMDIGINMIELQENLDQLFWWVCFLTGFVGALVIGVIAYDLIDRNKRRLKRWRGLK